MIFTRSGLKRADEIKVGDDVLTHRGRFPAVMAVSRRQASELMTIRAKSLDPITLTPDHPVYAWPSCGTLVGISRRSARTGYRLARYPAAISESALAGR